MSYRFKRAVFAWMSAAAAVLALLFIAPSARAAGSYAMTISTSATTNVTFSAGVFTPTANGANLNVTQLVGALNTGNVSVGGAGTSSITIDNSIAYTGSKTLTFAGNTAVAGPLTVQAGTVDFSDPVTGSGSLTITGNARFASGVNGLGAVSISDNAEFDYAVFVTSSIGSLSVGGTSSLAGDIVTTSSQTYMGAVTLTWDTELSGGQVSFESLVDGPYSLSVSGAVSFQGAVGSLTPLEVLNCGSTTLDGNVTTSGSQNYGPVTLAASSVALVGPNVAFASTVDGAANLGIVGNAQFDGDVGGSVELSSLSVTGTATPGQDIFTSGDQTYDGPVYYGIQIPTFSGHDLTFGSWVSGYGFLILGNGTTRLNGAVETTGPQTYTEPVVLTNNVRVGAQLSQASFTAAVSGSGFGLTVDQGTVALESAGDAFSGGATVAGGTLEFVNGGLGSGPITLNGGTLKWASGNTEDISALLQAVGPNGATLNTNGNDVSFADAIGGAGGPLTKTGTGTLSLDATTGGYGDQLRVGGGTLAVDGTTVNTPISVLSGGTLSCSNGGTLSSGVTNNGGTLNGAPNAPTVTSAADDDGPTASVGFTAGTPNCLPVTYTAQTTAGGYSSSPSSASPLLVDALAAGATYAFTVIATNPIGSTTSGNSMSASTPGAPSISRLPLQARGPPTALANRSASAMPAPTAPARASAAATARSVPAPCSTQPSPAATPSP